MTDKQKEAIRERAKQELEVFDVFLEETKNKMPFWSDEDTKLKIALAAYLSAGLTDIHNAIEGLYGELEIGE